MSRLIDAEKLKEIINRVFPCKDKDDANIRKAVKMALIDCPTVDAIPIPKGVSNLDMLKAVFPNIEITYSKYDAEGTPHIVMVHGLDGITSLTAEWANAPYKMEEPEITMEEERE